MESQNIYRIVWKNKKNQHIGCGTQLFNINEANDFVKILNKKFNNDKRSAGRSLAMPGILH